jgi:hypothetical protein
MCSLFVAAPPLFPFTVSVRLTMPHFVAFRHMETIGRAPTGDKGSFACARCMRRSTPTVSTLSQHIQTCHSFETRRAARSLKCSQAHPLTPYMRGHDCWRTLSRNDKGANDDIDDLGIRHASNRSRLN